MCLDAFKLVKVHIKYSNTIIKIKTTNNMGKKNFFKKKSLTKTTIRMRTDKLIIVYILN